MLLTLSAPNNHHNCMTHHPLGVTRVLVQVHRAPCSRTCDVSSKRPCSSRFGACNSDGWIASSSICVTTHRYSCANHSRHPTASKRCTSSAPTDHAGALGHELALDTHVASMAVHGCFSWSSAARRRQHWCIYPMRTSWLRLALSPKTNSCVFFCSLSLTMTVCDEARG